jgi:integrase/recombinase XerD
MGRIREKMIRDLELRNLAVSTQEIYLRERARFVEHYRRSPAEMGLEEVLAYLSGLEQRGASPMRRHLAGAGIRFLYGVTLDRPEVAGKIPWPKVPVTEPDILSGAEVAQVLAAVEPLRNRVILTVAYGAGLRISECCRLQVGDIDGRRMLIHVRQGKGGRDRFVVLGPKLLQVLRDYWAAVRPPGPALFPGNGPTGVIGRKTLNQALKDAVKRLGIQKKVTPHVFRHSCATQWLELGTDLRSVQVSLGHRSIRSTFRYTHVTPRLAARLRSPLDVLGTPEGQPLG